MEEERKEGRTEGRIRRKQIRHGIPRKRVGDDSSFLLLSPLSALSSTRDRVGETHFFSSPCRVTPFVAFSSASTRFESNVAKRGTARKDDRRLDACTLEEPSIVANERSRGKIIR